MKQRILTEGLFDEYFQEILEKAINPELNINCVIEPLREMVLNNRPIEITVATRNGVRGNSCWVEYNDRTRYFTYHHHTHQIVIKDRSKRGTILASVTNSTNLSAVVEPLLRD